MSVVVVLPTVFQCPETLPLIVTGTAAAQSVNPSPTLTFPRATRCFRRFSVMLLACMGGQHWMSGGGTWKAVALRTAPSPSTSLNVLTRIGPSAAPDGTRTLSRVGVSGAPVCVAVAEYGAKRTSPPTMAVVIEPEFLRRFLPVIVTTVISAAPAQGQNEVMVGEQVPGLVLVKSVGLFAVPLALVTWIVPLVVPATVAQIVVAETILNSVNGVPPISTLDTSGLSKSVPVISITQPAGPLVGENDVMVGMTANAIGIPKDIEAAAETMIKMTRTIRFIPISTPLGAGWSASATAGGGARDRRGLINREALPVRSHATLAGSP